MHYTNSSGIIFDKVVSMESCGSFFGPYGTDILEIHNVSIKKGENVLIHVAVLVTGGTARAICQLIERLGGNIIACNFLIELDFLNGKEKLKRHEIQSLMHY